MGTIHKDIGESIKHRNECRENEIDKRKELDINKCLDKQPIIAEFKVNFKVMTQDYLTNIEKCKIRSDFDGCSDTLVSMQELISKAVNYLPKYDIYQSQKVIDQYRKELLEKRDIVAPRSAFSFTKKKKNITKKPKEYKVIPVRNENYDKYLDNEIGLRDISGDKNVVLDVVARDVNIVNLSNCNVKICGTPASIHMINIDNCRIICAPVTTSVMIENCKNSIMVIACQQMRIHSTFDTDIYLHVIAKAIIEDCKNVKFAKFDDYPINCDEIKEIGNSYINSKMFTNADNHWNDVDDFNWLSKDIQSPNWSILPDSDKIIQL